MTQESFTAVLARAIAEHEGFYITPEQAAWRNIRWPTRAQRHANPGNIRNWSRAHPVEDGYINFYAWADIYFPQDVGITRKHRAEGEGWRVLKALIAQYIRGKYTRDPETRQEKPPTLRQFFAVYAPKEDANDPKSYAAAVCAKLNKAGYAISLDDVIKDWLEANVGA